MFKGYGPDFYELFYFCLLLSIVHYVVEIHILIIVLPIWPNIVIKLYSIIILLCQM